MIKNWPTSKTIVTFFFALAVASFASRAIAEPPRLNSVVVFDAADRVCDRIDIRTTCCGAVDVSGKYRVVLVRPRLHSGNFVSISQPPKYQDTIVMFAWIKNDELIPIFPWQSFRASARPKSDRLSARWPEFEIAELRRKSHIEYPEVQIPSQLWALKLRASDAAAEHVELQVHQRPDWQRQFARHIEFPALGAPSHDVESSRESTYLNGRLTTSGTQLSFRQQLIAHEDRIKMYFLPKRPIVPGDVVRVAIPSTGAQEFIRCHSGPDRPFPRVELRQRADANAEPTLLVNVGGVSTHPSPYNRIEGLMELPDGERIEFSGNTRNGVMLEWPAHCPTTGCTFWIEGTARGTASSIQLPRTEYTLIEEDSGFVGTPELSTLRFAPPCLAPMSPDVGGSLRISLGKERQDCPACRCGVCQSW